MIVVWELDLDVGRSRFKCLLSHEASPVTLGQSLSLTSQGFCEDKRVGGTVYTALSFLKEGWFKNVKNEINIVGLEELQTDAPGWKKP